MPQFKFYNLFKFGFIIVGLISLTIAVGLAYFYVQYYRSSHQSIQQHRDEGQNNFLNISNPTQASCLITTESRQSHWIYTVASRSSDTDLSPSELRRKQYPIQFFAPILFSQQDTVYLWLRCAHENCHDDSVKSWSEILFKQPQTQLNRQQFAQLVALQRAPSRYLNDSIALQQRTEYLLQRASECLD
ncbi:MAG: hypothetical protein VXW65_07830 [Pseudomonadota bacterium]|nr:hypothetical protein [Pseudomonadota bacterium]